MKVGLLVDVLNEHSGARAAIKLGEALARLEGVGVVFIGSNRLLDQDLIIRLASKNKVRLFSKPPLFSFALLKIIGEEGLDVISAHCSLRILISAHLSGVKILRTDYGTQFPSLNNDYDLWRVSFATRVINLVADAFVWVRDGFKFFFCRASVAISVSGADQAGSLYRRKIPHIYLGSDNFLSAADGPAGVSHPLTILSVSRFVPYKGFHRLVEVFQSLEEEFPNSRLFLVGGQGRGRYFSFLENLIKDDRRIHLVFDPADDLLVQLFGETDIYASATRWEGFGLTFLEASSLGLPTLGFNFFGPAQEVILDGKTGFLVSNRDEFRERLRQLMADQKLRQDLGKAGRIFAQKFTWAGCAQSYAQKLTEL